MDEQTQEYRINRWMGILNDCAQSGMKKKAYCKLHGINEKTFYYWQRRLRDQLSLALNAQMALRQQSPSTQTAFVELRSSSHVASQKLQGIAVLQYGKATITLSPDIDEALLLKLLRVCNHAG